MKRSHHIQGFLDYIRVEQNLAKNTILSYTFDLAKFDKWLPPERTFESVTRTDLRAFIACLHEKHTIASVRRVVAVLKQFYRFLRVEGVIQANPVDDMPRMKVPAMLPRYLEWEQVEALIQAPFTVRACSEPARHRNHALLEVLAATGCRISEVVDLQLHDVVGGAVRLYGKGRKERIVPLHRRAEKALAAYINDWRPLQRPTCDYIFVNRSGVQVSRRIVQKEIQAYAKAVGITVRVHPHMLRHSLATELVRQGAPLTVVRDLLGHTSLTATNVYAHCSPETLRAAYMQYHPAR